MSIKIIAVGKNKQTYIQEGIQNYVKQMKSIEILEVLDEKNMDGMEKEGARILELIEHDAYVIVLAIKGKMLSSEQFAEKLDHIYTYESQKIVFVIGGSYGLANSVYKRADFEMSFSKMTLPHLLMRIVLIEQIYRAQMILKNHPYHK